MASFMDKSSFTPFQLLMEAAQQGNAEDVERLIPLCPSPSLNNMVLWMAISHGHNRCIELLTPVSDPLNNNSGALTHAAGQGNCEGVKLLLPFSNMLENNSAALMEAARNGHQTCVDILAPVSNVEEVYSKLKKAHPNAQTLLQYLEEKVWILQQKRLSEEIEGVGKDSVERVRKM